MRSDAIRNRQRLLEAADRIFRERGFEVTISEIAEAADVGRATLFRNFPTKEDLIAAIAIERMTEWIEDGWKLLKSSDDDAEILFTFIGEMVNVQEANRALMEAVTDEFASRPDLAICHDALHEVLDEAIGRSKRAGSIRPELVATDVIILIKGLCASIGMLSPENPDVLRRHLELIRAALSTPEYARPLAGAPAVLTH